MATHNPTQSTAAVDAWGFTQADNDRISIEEQTSDIRWAKDVIAGKEEGNKNHAYWTLGFLAAHGFNAEVRGLVGAGPAV